MRSFDLFISTVGIMIVCAVVSLQSCPILWDPVAHQAPLSMGFSGQEYWRGLPCPPPGDLPDPGVKPESLASPALAGGFFATSSTYHDSKVKYKVK